MQGGNKMPPIEELKFLLLMLSIVDAILSIAIKLLSLYGG